MRVADARRRRPVSSRGLCELLPLLTSEIEELAARRLKVRGAIVGRDVLGRTGDGIDETPPGEIASVDEVLQDVGVLSFSQCELFRQNLDCLVRTSFDLQI